MRDTIVTPELLRERGIVHRRRADQGASRGDIAKKLTVRAHKISGKAAEKIAAAGGAAETIGGA
jgi:large subunit ribosomal protein L15